MGMDETIAAFARQVSDLPTNTHVEPGRHRYGEQWYRRTAARREMQRLNADKFSRKLVSGKILRQEILHSLRSGIMLAIDDVQNAPFCHHGVNLRLSRWSVIKEG
jgi:hypothetical protein